MTDIGPGTRVECIKDDWVGFARGEIFPVLGCVYTVREVVTYDGFVGIRLVEIVNKPRRYIEAFGEMAFSVERFRPIGGTETGMKIIYEALENPKELIDA